MNPRVAAIVPARAGSKGVKNKNIRALNGKPLIAHTLDTVLAVDLVKRIVVSTDSDQVMEIAAAYAKVGLLARPKELATDTASGIDVFRHGIQHVRMKYGDFDYYVYLQPTSPLRAPEDIQKALSIAVKKGALSVVSVCECAHHPFWCNVLPKTLSLEGFIPAAIRGKNRQDLPTYYQLNGAIYVVSAELGNSTLFDFFGPRSFACVMPKDRSIDIDSEEDFLLAELILSQKAKNR